MNMRHVKRRGSEFIGANIRVKRICQDSVKRLHEIGITGARVHFENNRYSVDIFGCKGDK